MGLKTGGGAGQPKEKRENKWKSRGLKKGAGRANLREKEKTNGLVGAKTGGGATYEKRENEWISRGSKQGVGQANRRKREKTNNEKGLKTEDRLGQPKIKKEYKWIFRPNHRGHGGPT